MLNYTRINPWHFLIKPSEYISKLFKKIGVNFNLFKGTISSDEDIFNNVGNLGNFLE